MIKLNQYVNYSCTIQLYTHTADCVCTHSCILVWFTERENKSFEEDEKTFSKFLFSRFVKEQDIDLHALIWNCIIKVHIEPFLRTDNLGQQFCLMEVWSSLGITPFFLLRQGVGHFWAESGVSGHARLLPDTLAHAIVVLHNALPTGHKTSHDGRTYQVEYVGRRHDRTFVLGAGFEFVQYGWYH